MAKKNPIKNVKKKAPVKPGTTKKKAKGKTKDSGLSSKARKRMLYGTWIMVFFPFILIGVMILSIPSEEIPDYKMLENPVNNQASVVFAQNEKILGTFFLDNRSDVEFYELPENLSML